MSKRSLKYGFLPKLQKKIALALAKYGIMNIAETNKRIKGHESATNLAFHKLESKGIVEKVECYSYRGREFWKYWLTERGMAYVLMNGANLEKVKDIALRLNKEKVYFDLRSISPTIANILDMIIIFNGKLSPEELTRRLALEASALGETEMLEFLATLKESGKFDDALEKTKENMKKLIDRMEKP